MIKTVKKYLKIFWILQTARLSQELGFRLNFVFEFLGSYCFFILHLISFKFLLSKYSFPGWSTGEAWVLLFTFEIFTYLSFFILYKGLTRTVVDIKTGGLDIILAKPVQSRLIAFFRSGGLHNLATGMLGVVYLVLTLLEYEFQISIFSILMYIISILSSIWILHCMSVIVMSFNFYAEQISGGDSFVSMFQEGMKYPSQIYSNTPILLRIFVYAFAILTTFPTVLLLTKNVSYQLIMSYLIFLILVTITSQLIWNFSLRHYSSASS